MSSTQRSPVTDDCLGRSLQSLSSLHLLYYVRCGGKLSVSVSEWMYVSYPILLVPRTAWLFLRMYSPRMFTRIPYMNKSNASPRKPKKKAQNLSVRGGSSARPSVGSQILRFQTASGPVKRSSSDISVDKSQHGNLSGSSKPSIKDVSPSGGDQRIRVRHREFVGDLLGSILFAITAWSVNPGLASLFPWLSNLARNYESYRFIKLVFQYRTQCATSTGGKGMIAVDYDAADDIPDNKVEMMQNRTKGDGPPWLDFDVICDHADLNKFSKERYVRSSAELPSNVDIKTYDVGQLFTAAQDQVANGSKIGELYVVYDVILMTPATPNLEFLSASAAAKITSGGTTNRANPFGSVPVILQTVNPVVAAAASNVNFNIPGTYLFDQILTGTGITAGPVLTGSSADVGISLINAVINAAGTGSQATYLIDTVLANQSVDFNATTTATTITNSVSRVADWVEAIF